MGRRQSALQISLFSFQDIITSVTGILILLTLLMALTIAQQSKAKSQVSHSKEGEKVAEQLEAVRANVHMLEQALQELNHTNQQLKEASSFDGDEILSQLQEEALNAERAYQQAASENESANEKLSEVQQDLDQQTADRQRIEQLREQIEKDLAMSSRLVNGDIFAFSAGANANRTWLIEFVNEGFRLIRADGSNSTPWAPAEQLKPILAKLSPRQHALVFLVRPSGVAKLRDLESLANERGFGVGIDLVAEDVEILLKDREEGRP